MQSWKNFAEQVDSFVAILWSWGYSTKRRGQFTWWTLESESSGFYWNSCAPPVCFHTEDWKDGQFTIIMSQTVMKPKLWIKVTSTDQDENTVPAISPAYERIRNASESGSSASPCNSSCCLGPKSPAAGSGATTPAASPVSPGYLQRKRRSTTLNECKISCDETFPSRLSIYFLIPAEQNVMKEEKL